MNISPSKSISSMSNFFKNPINMIDSKKLTYSVTVPVLNFKEKRSNSAPQPPTKDSSHLSNDMSSSGILTADASMEKMNPQDTDATISMKLNPPHDDSATAGMNPPKELGEKKCDEWFEKNSNSFTLLDPSTGKASAKDLAKLEKKFPEALQDSIVENMRLEGFKDGGSIDANNQHKFIRDNLSSVFRATVDKKIIDILKASGNDTAVEQYQNKYLSLDPINYNDILELDKMASDLKDSHSLGKDEQGKLLTSVIAKLDNLHTNSLSEDPQEVLQNAKKGMTNLERSLPLVDKAQMNKPDLIKTLLASGGLAASLAALGALISLLVKLGGSASADEVGEANEPVDDQTVAIDAKQQDIEAKQQDIDDLKAQQQKLLDNGANLSEEEIKTNAELAGLQEVINKNEVVYDNTDEGVKNPKPSLEGEKTIEKFVNKAVADHRENQTALNNIKSEIKSAEDNLETLQEEITNLQYKQGQHEAQKDINPASVEMKNPNTNSETGMLASLGIGALLATAGGCGLFAINHSKISPKFKLQRARRQASQSLNKLINSNQSQFVEIPRVINDLPTPQTIERNNTL